MSEKRTIEYFFNSEKLKYPIDTMVQFYLLNCMIDLFLEDPSHQTIILPTRNKVI